FELPFEVVSENPIVEEAPAEEDARDDNRDQKPRRPETDGTAPQAESSRSPSPAKGGPPGPPFCFPHLPLCPRHRLG
ncbi:MAG: hypothetical protein ACK5VI_03970, partial [Opitutia bacterium]